MKSIFIIILTGLVVLSCSKYDFSNTWEQRCLSNNFYYSSNGKNTLDSILVNSHILIGLEATIPNDEILDFINSNTNFVDIQPDQILEYAKNEFKIVITELRSEKNCSQLNYLFKNLMTNSLVSFANPVYNGSTCVTHGFDTNNAFSYTDQFFVRVHDPKDLSDLNNTINLFVKKYPVPIPRITGVPSENIMLKFELPLINQVPASVLLDGSS